MNILKKISMLGPGILLSAMIAGRTHVVLLPAAGAFFGYSLLWVVILAFFFNYFYYDFGVRYIGATGNSILSAWVQFMAKGRQWVLYFVFGAILTMTPLLFAAYMSILGSITVSLFPAYTGGFTGAALSWAFLTFFTILVGRYKGLEWLSKGFMLTMFIVFATAFLLRPPDILQASQGLIPTAFPIAALAFIVPIMAMPGSPADLAIMSSWIMEKKKMWLGSSKDPKEQKKHIFHAALLDLRIGWLITFATAIFTFSLGAAVLYPNTVPVGIETMITISHIFTETIGPWTFFLFITGVVVAIFGSAINSMDGSSRLAGRVLNGFKGKLDEVGHISGSRLMPLVWSIGAGTTMAILYLEPVILTIIAGAAYLIMFPICYIIHIWAVNNLIEDEAYKPKKTTILIAKLGFCWVTIGMILTAYIFATGIKIY